MQALENKIAGMRLVQTDSGRWGVVVTLRIAGKDDKFRYVIVLIEDFGPSPGLGAARGITIPAIVERGT